MGQTIEENLRNEILQNKDLNTLKYRQWYQENKVKKSISPWVHPVFNFGALTLTILFSLSQVKVWNWEQLFTAFLTLLLGNLVVFLLHRYPLHKRYKIAPFPYDRHTVEHHRYYDYRNIVLDGPDDFSVIFFPWFIILSFILFVCPIFFSVGYFVSGPSLGWFAVAAAAGYFTLYEVVHLSCHLPTDHWWLKIPGLKAMHEHHRLHHHPRLMSRYNFCIVYPLFDYILGTKYKGEVPEANVSPHTEDVLSNLN